MARGTALSTLLIMLKAEIGDYAGTNTSRDAELSQLLSNKQLQLKEEFRWSFLIRRWNSAVAANQQFVQFPTVDADFGETALIDTDQLESVEVKWNSVYFDVEYGIGEEEYNALDFSLGQQTDPIQRWREASNIVEASQPNKFEVWPVPVTPQVMRFTGERQLLPLAVANDTADLDDMLVVLGVAADKLARSKQADAQLKLQAFGRRLRQLGVHNQTRRKCRILGGGGSNDFKRSRKLAGLIIATK